MRSAIRGLVDRVHPFLFIRLAIVAVLLVVISDTQPDPDLWGHIQFGADTAAAQTIVRADPYSFTSDIPWTNHEWLSELVTWFAWAAAGAAGLVLLKLLLLSTALTVVLRSIHRAFYAVPVFELLLLLFVFGTRRQAATVRPQLFSLALFALLLFVLRRFERGHTRALLAVPAIIALWANLHGGWIVGLGTFGLWAVFRFVTPGVAAAERVRIAAIGIASVLASLINPYGIELWTFLQETVGPVRADIQDWQPVWALEPAVWLLWIVIAAGTIAILVTSRGPRPLGHYAIVAFFAAASLWVNRLDMFFALSALVLLPVHPLPKAHGPSRSSIWPDVASTSAQRFVVAGAATLAVAVALVITVRNARCIALDDDDAWLPEYEVVSAVRSRQLQGRLLVWFDWGEYAIWHLAPTLRISMDGRRETVYSTAVQDEHTRFYYDLPSGADLPTRLNADYIWIPKRLPIVSTLRAAPDWHVLFEGPQSLFFARTAHPLLPIPVNPSSGRRCFPGP